MSPWPRELRASPRCNNLCRRENKKKGNKTTSVKVNFTSNSVCTVIDHRWRQNAITTLEWHGVSLMFPPRFGVYCDLLLYIPTGTWSVRVSFFWWKSKILLIATSSVRLFPNRSRVKTQRIWTVNILLIILYKIKGISVDILWIKSNNHSDDKVNDISTYSFPRLPATSGGTLHRILQKKYELFNKYLPLDRLNV